MHAPWAESGSVILIGLWTLHHAQSAELQTNRAKRCCIAAAPMAKSGKASGGWIRAR
jgi:hypothetical protein